MCAQQRGMWGVMQMHGRPNCLPSEGAGAFAKPLLGLSTSDASKYISPPARNGWRLGASWPGLLIQYNGLNSSSKNM